MNSRHLVMASMGAGLTLVGGLAGFAVRALADGIPAQNSLYYAGTLTENGAPVNGSRPLTVNLWSNASPVSGETPLCTTGANSMTPVAGGRFRIALDGMCKGAINANPNVHVELVDNGTSLGRSPIGAVPYAVEADHAMTAATANGASGALASSISALQAIVTSWAAYTPTITASGSDIGSSTTTSAFWRRLGDTVQVRLTTTFASCPQSGRIEWTLPSGVAIDSAKSYASEALGGGIAFNGTVRTLAVTAVSGTTFALDVSSDSGGGMACSGVGAGGVVRFSLQAPVQGWTVAGP